MNKFTLVFLLSLLAIASAANSSIFLNETYYTGYVPLENGTGAHWYWLFESRQSPSTDPLVIWVPDGPAHTAASSALVLNGPFKINSDNTTLSINPYSWNNIANMLYIEAPIGVGFSYADSNDSLVVTNQDIADGVYYLLKNFLEDHPEYKGRDVYLGTLGTSASFFVWICNTIIENSEGLDINFKGWMLGDPVIYPYIQYPVPWAEYAYQHNLINETYYNTLLEDMKPIQDLLSQAENETALIEGSDDAYEILDNITGPVPPYNPLNIVIPCSYPDSSTVWCYDFSSVGAFILQPDVVAALNVTRPEVWKWQNVTSFLNVPYTVYNMDNTPELSTLIKSGYPGVILEGMNDMLWNFIGVEAILNNVEWNGQAAWATLNFTLWEGYGDYKHLDNLTYVRLNNSGFFVPIDQPYPTLLGLDNLIKNEGW